jgi:hypothetical protein
MPFSLQLGATSNSSRPEDAERNTLPIRAFARQHVDGHSTSGGEVTR